MEYSEESVRDRGVLTPPQPIRTTLPERLHRARMVVICTLDASGNLKNIRVLEAWSRRNDSKGAGRFE